MFSLLNTVGVVLMGVSVMPLTNLSIAVCAWEFYTCVCVSMKVNRSATIDNESR